MSSAQKPARPGSSAVKNNQRRRGGAPSESQSNAGPASSFHQRAINGHPDVQEGLVEDQIERAHALSCEEIIRQHDAVVADLQRDNQMLREENELLRAQIGETQAAKATLQNDMVSATQYMASLEDKVYKSNKTSLDLLTNLRDREVEVETLKSYIIDLKARIAVYIPVKDCPVDKKLAEYINNYPDRQKLKIMFMRESEGVYEFGSRRVLVKVERDKIQIKVGGGYLSIDEFLDQYTPAELEKLERRDPLKRFSEKVAIQKTIGDKTAVETSPVRKTSPNKRTR